MESSHQGENNLERKGKLSKKAAQELGDSRLAGKKVIFKVERTSGGIPYAYNVRLFPSRNPVTARLSIGENGIIPSRPIK